MYCFHQLQTGIGRAGEYLLADQTGGHDQAVWDGLMVEERRKNLVAISTVRATVQR